MRDHLRGRLPGVIGAERLWSFSFVDDVAGAHVAALTASAPARDYVVGGVNAPQQRDLRLPRATRAVCALPRRMPYAVATAAALVEEAAAAVFHRAPLADARRRRNLSARLVAGERRAARAELGLTMTPLDGRARAHARVAERSPVPFLQRQALYPANSDESPWHELPLLRCRATARRTKARKRASAR